MIPSIVRSPEQILRGARTIAVDHASHEVFLPAAKFAPAKPGERRGAMEKASFGILVLAP